MKLNSKLNVYYLFIVVWYISLQSCSVMGLTVGAIMDKNDNKDYNVPIIEGKGWIQPPSTKHNLELLLTNNKSIFGRYQGIVKNETKRNPKLILLKVGKLEKTIPTTHIAYTKILSVEKNRSKTGFIVGLSIDVATIILFLFADEPIIDPIGNSLKWN